LSALILQRREIYDRHTKTVLFRLILACFDLFAEGQPAKKDFYELEKTSMTLVDIGIFAHNEADGIRAMLRNFLAQELFRDPAFDVHLHILANGCTDATVAEAQQAIFEQGATIHTTVHDFPEGGKSRTWNRFVHDISRPEAETLAFFDADIYIPQPHMLRDLCNFLLTSPNLSGVSSRPVKDIIHDASMQNGYRDKLIAAATGTLNDWKSSIAGSLYLLRSNIARSFHMPIGLPCEDGFARAMVQTHNFSQEGAPEIQLDGLDEIYHIYASERSVKALIQHQTRLVIGSAINSVIYARLRSLSSEDRMRELEESARHPQWLPNLLDKELPKAPYGYVPTHFLFKRVQYWANSPNKFSPKRISVTAAGFAFDAIVYACAQFKMWRGTGAGHW